ncbi:hypothetical protein V6N13_075151 [Hibiscus sabdariffa]
MSNINSFFYLQKAYVIHWVRLDQHSSVEKAYIEGMNHLEKLVARVHDVEPPKLSPGTVDFQTHHFGPALKNSNMSSEEFKKAVLKAKEHIMAGDIFQIVLSQRFERRTFADPFEIYRALRVVNPSPYMAYLQARGGILVASSPEILTRVKKNKIVNRPLAGTARRGKTLAEDEMAEKQLLSNEKECAEHTMLVDLGRNDVGKVSKYGSVKVEKLMNIERYSHVMHISSTVTGELQDHLTSWDALRAALPVGTVSGAPKVKAMELIDELEVSRRGPYSGGFGGISFTGDMDIALALRTMVFTTLPRFDTIYSYKGADRRHEWVAYLQAGAGIVADSDPDAEHLESVAIIIKDLGSSNRSGVLNNGDPILLLFLRIGNEVHGSLFRISSAPFTVKHVATGITPRGREARVIIDSLNQNSLPCFKTNQRRRQVFMYSARSGFDQNSTPS